MKKLLFVDDEEFYRTLIPMALKGLFEVQTACDAEEAAGMLKSISFDVVMTDYVMGEGHNGIWLLEEVKKKQPGVLRVLFSGSEPDEFEEHLKSGLVRRLIPKMSTVEEIVEGVSFSKKNPGSGDSRGS